MNNQELDKLLKSAEVAEPGKDFWAELPMNVQRRMARANLSTGARDRVEPSRRPFFLKLAAPLAFAAICVAIGFFWGAHGRRDARVQIGELAEARACWREASALFPNQLEAIVLGRKEPQMVLSEKAGQPMSAPIFLKVCDGKDCRRFVTFSGQRIKVGGESFEVLIDLKGEVLLVGEAKVWKSSAGTTDFGVYKVFARLLASS